MLVTPIKSLMMLWVRGKTCSNKYLYRAVKEAVSVPVLANGNIQVTLCSGKGKGLPKEVLIKWNASSSIILFN